MIIFLDAQGNIVTTSAPEPIGRNSNNANIIYIVAPFSSAANIYMTFTLPNGEPLFGGLLDPTDREDLTQAAHLFTLPDSALSAWRYLPRSSVTRLSGVVQYTIVTVTESMRATASGTFTVSRGNRLILPETPTPDVWNDLLQIISYKNADIDEIISAIQEFSEEFSEVLIPYFEKTDAVCEYVPCIRLNMDQSPLSLLIETAEKYGRWPRQVIVSGVARFNIYTEKNNHDEVLEFPPFTRVEFHNYEGVMYAVSYTTKGSYLVEIVGDPSDNAIKFLKIAETLPLFDSVHDLDEHITNLENDLSYSYGTSISLKMDDSGEHIITVELKNKRGEVISSQFVDLPLETIVERAELSEDGKLVIITFSSGDVVRFDAEDILKSALGNKLDKITEPTDHIELYGKSREGTQEMYALGVSIPIYEAPSFAVKNVLKTVKVCDPYGDEDSVNLRYATANFFAIPKSGTGTRIPCVYEDGTSGVYGIDTVNRTGKIPVYTAKPIYGTNDTGTGYITTAVPVYDYHCANKKYVDDAIREALYKLSSLIGDGV